MTYIPSHWFGSNPSWFLKRIPTSSIYKKTFAKPGLWTVFSPSIAMSMKVICVLRMKHFEMVEWLQLKKAGKHIGKLVFLSQTFGSVVLDTGCHVPAASLVPHRLHSLRTLGLLWSRKTSCNCHSIRGALICWHDSCFGL